MIFIPIDDQKQTGRPPGNAGIASEAKVGKDGLFTIINGTSVNYFEEPPGRRPGCLAGPHQVMYAKPLSKTPRIPPSDLEGLTPVQRKEMEAMYAAIPLFPEIHCGSKVDPEIVTIDANGPNHLEIKIKQ